MKNTLCGVAMRALQSLAEVGLQGVLQKIESRAKSVPGPMSGDLVAALGKTSTGCHCVGVNLGRKSGAIKTGGVQAPLE